MDVYHERCRMEQERGARGGASPQAPEGTGLHMGAPGLQASGSSYQFDRVLPTAIHPGSGQTYIS